MKNVSLTVHYDNSYKAIEVDSDIFSQRTTNCLLRAKIYTMYDVIEQYEKLKRLKGFGAKCMTEINSKILELELERRIA